MQVIALMFMLPIPTVMLIKLLGEKSFSKIKLKVKILTSLKSPNISKKESLLLLEF